MAAADLSSTNGPANPGRLIRVALIVKDVAERQALFEALGPARHISAVTFETVQGLSSSDIDPIDCVVISHHTLARFRAADVMSFSRLCRGARVIIALTSDHLLEASTTMRLADGWVFLDLNIAHLPDIVDLSREGYSIMPQAVIDRLTANKLRIDEFRRLSDLEKSVMSLVSEGFSNQEIAERIGLSGSHTKAIVKSALSRLHFQNRTQAAVFVARQVKPAGGTVKA